MPTTATQTEVKKMPKSEYISWDTFREQYLTLEDEYNYEWLDGKVEKTPRSMDRKQLRILRNLLLAFKGLEMEGKVYGYLIQEADLLFLKHHRRPDVCWLTDEQIDRLAEDADEVPAFVIEVISSNDMINRMVAKMKDYQLAGVQVVWQIFPEHQQVHVYSGEKLNEMKVCSGDMVCSAATVLPGFELPAKAVFGRLTTDG